MGGPYEAGSESTASSPDGLRFCRSPSLECGRRAQSKLDSISRNSRLPTYGDAANLLHRRLYQQGLPVTPQHTMGLPHASI
jgi:hypothetical protein